MGKAFVATMFVAFSVASVLVATVLLVGSASIAHAHANTQQYTIPPTTAPDTFTVPFNTGHPTPTEGIKFIVGGDRVVKTLKIEGNADVDITFEPPASPSEVTRYFVENPTFSESIFFTFTLTNESGQDRPLTITFIETVESI